MLQKLTETSAARRACWDEGVTLRRRGEDLSLLYICYPPDELAPKGENVPFELDEDWGKDPSDENATDWEIVET